ncbi:MAG: AAA family ATPase, partial [Candidatus Omnitrophica bacterium]|nr:AAA family ATPase [Candidatus Omnitrophota bacterium]
MALVFAAFKTLLEIQFSGNIEAMVIIAFANQKGGTGKTTACVNVAAGLARSSQRVLVVDLDPQGNATVSLGIRVRPEQATIAEFLLEQARLEEVMVDSYLGDVSIIPATPDLAHVELELATRSKNQFFLKRALERYQEIIFSFDFILIDCPPSLSLLTVNGLCASDYVVVPVMCDYLSLEGLSHLLDTIEQLRRKLNPHLQVLGILPTMVDYRLRLTEESLQLLRQRFFDLIFRTEIRTCSRLRESPSYGKAIFDYARSSVAAENFVSLVKELSQRVKRGEKEKPERRNAESHK